MRPFQNFVFSSLFQQQQTQRGLWPQPKGRPEKRRDAESAKSRRAFLLCVPPRPPRLCVLKNFAQPAKTFMDSSTNPSTPLISILQQMSWQDLVGDMDRVLELLLGVGVPAALVSRYTSSPSRRMRIGTITTGLVVPLLYLGLHGPSGYFFGSLLHFSRHPTRFACFGEKPTVSSTVTVIHSLPLPAGG